MKLFCVSKLPLLVTFGLAALLSSSASAAASAHLRGQVESAEAPLPANPGLDMPRQLQVAEAPLPLDVDPFSPKEAAFVGVFAKFVLKGLAKGALSKVGEEAFGWALSLVGVDWGGEDLGEVKKQLNEQTKMLQDIQNSLQALERQLERAVDDIINAIEDTAEHNQFVSWVASLNQNVGTILGFSDSLRVWSMMDPSKSLEQDIQAFRNSVLNTIPQAIRSIDGALMGTPFSEGMIPLFARIQWKLSGDVNQYAATFHSMIEYYEAYQILGLQLMFEAYHAADPPQSGSCEAYYDIWSGFVGRQLEEYARRSPLANKVDEFDADKSNKHIIGRFKNILPTTEHIYFLNNTGWMHRTTIDGQKLQSDNARLWVTGFCHGFVAEDEDSVYAVGCSDQNALMLVATKYDKATFTNQGQVFMPRPGLLSGEKVRPRGVELDPKTKTLYVVQYLDRQFNTTIQAVDTTTWSYDRDTSIVIPGQTPYPGTMKIIDEDFLVYVSSTREISIVDRDSFHVVGYMQGPSGTFSTSTGIWLASQWTDFPNVVHITVQDSVGNLVDEFALGSTSGDVQADANGLIGYSTGGTSSTFMKTNYTLFDPKGPETMLVQDPNFVHGIDAVAMTDDLLYFAGWNGGKGHVVSYNRSFPIEDLPVLGS